MSSSSFEQEGRVHQPRSKEKSKPLRVDKKGTGPSSDEKKKKKPRFSSPSNKEK